MATVGEQLRRRRDQAGLTLSEVSARTRVPEWILTEVERDELTRVPGGVYIRGYITSFARVVGLDGDQLWAKYCADSQPVPETTAPPPVTVPKVRRWTFVSAASVVLAVGALWYNATRHHADASVVEASVLGPSDPDPTPQPSTRDVVPTPPPIEPIAEVTLAPAEVPTTEPPPRAAAKHTRKRSAARALPVATTTDAEPAPAVAAESTDAAPTAADAQ